jgi:hypothetical protein
VSAQAFLLPGRPFRLFLGHAGAPTEEVVEVLEGKSSQLSLPYPRTRRQSSSVQPMPRAQTDQTKQRQCPDDSARGGDVVCVGTGAGGISTRHTLEATDILSPFFIALQGVVGGGAKRLERGEEPRMRVVRVGGCASFSAAIDHGGGSLNWWSCQRRKLLAACSTNSFEAGGARIMLDAPPNSLFRGSPGRENSVRLLIL